MRIALESIDEAERRPPAASSSRRKIRVSRRDSSAATSASVGVVSGAGRQLDLEVGRPR